MVSGGVLNKEIDDAILVEGKSQVANTDSKTSIDYPYMVGENTAEIEVETGKEENAVPEYKDETKNAVAVKLSRTNIDLGPEALTVAADGNIVNKSLEEKAKEITGYKVGDDLTITIKTYLDMSVEKANITTAGSKDNTFSVDITPKYVIVAKATGSDEKVVSKSKDLSVTRTVPLKIYLPLGFANYPSDRVWIKHHLKDGSSVVYGGEEGLPIKLEVADMVVEFDNPDGFSVFDVYLKKVEPDPKPSPAPTPKPGYIVPNTGVN